MSVSCMHVDFGRCIYVRTEVRRVIEEVLMLNEVAFRLWLVM